MSYFKGLKLTNTFTGVGYGALASITTGATNNTGVGFNAGTSINGRYSR